MKNYSAFVVMHSGHEVHAGVDYGVPLNITESGFKEKA